MDRPFCRQIRHRRSFVAIQRIRSSESRRSRMIRELLSDHRDDNQTQAAGRRKDQGDRQPSKAPMNYREIKAIET